MSASSVAPREPMRLLILGSCVSRDILASANDRQFALVDYFARSSIASISAKPFELDEEHLERISSNFQRRMVQRDLDKSFLSLLKTRPDVDFILIDLIDERFDLYETESGAIVTVSSEMSLTRFIQPADRASHRSIRSGSDRHRRLWSAGLAKLFQLLAERGIADRVIVNKVFWTATLEDGSPLPQQNIAQREAANELLAWMYDRLAQYVPPSRWLIYPETLLRSDPQHRWGISPFHYGQAYYAEAIAQLNQLFALRSTAGGIMSEGGLLTVWAGITHTTAATFCFIVFRNGELLFTQPYSYERELRFDTKGVGGKYQVTILTLTFDAKAQLQDAANRHLTTLEFDVPHTV